MPRALLLFHGLLSFALAGASTHLALVTLSFLRGRPPKLRLARIYSVVAGLLFVAAFLGGALLYPDYRYAVRGLYLDRHAPWASNLFDFKETLAALALPLALGLLVLGRGFDGEDRPARSAFAFCAFGVWLVVAFDVVSGLLVVAERSVS